MGRLDIVPGLGHGTVGEYRGFSACGKSVHVDEWGIKWGKHG